MNRRMTCLGASLIIGIAAIVSLHAQRKTRLTAVHQEIDLRAAPARVYESLLDAKQFAAFTKDTAEIQNQPGGNFKLFGGRIEGRNIELARNQRIIQAWRSSSWPAGVYTLVKFELVASGSGTRIIFDQTGHLPDEAEWEHLNEGWPLMYWEPMRKYLDK